MFSPYYAWARRGGAAADADNHCALNVALYGRGGKRWAMTERGRGAMTRDAGRFVIGPSALAWDGTCLTITIDERTMPIPRRIRGTVRVYPTGLGDRCFMLDAAGAHRWMPLAPTARVEVALSQPGLAWSGPGYLDHNTGDAPLERDFARWDWCRASIGRDAAMLYDVTRRDGSNHMLALHAAADGTITDIPCPTRAALPGTRIWRIGRGTHADHGHAARVVETLEDTPFYARSVLSTHLLGAPAQAVHESLSLARFAQPWVQVLLPFRMPRRA